MNGMPFYLNSMDVHPSLNQQKHKHFIEEIYDAVKSIQQTPQSCLKNITPQMLNYIYYVNKTDGIDSYCKFMTIRGVTVNLILGEFHNEYTMFHVPDQYGNIEYCITVEYKYYTGGLHYNDYLRQSLRLFILLLDLYNIIDDDIYDKYLYYARYVLLYKLICDSSKSFTDIRKICDDSKLFIPMSKLVYESLFNVNDPLKGLIIDMGVISLLGDDNECLDTPQK